MEELKKYKVMGQFVVDVEIEIEATNEDEAMDIVSGSIGTEEYCNGTVGVNAYEFDHCELFANYVELLGCEEV